jgi:ketosteroid isomerase-like protein
VHRGGAVYTTFRAPGNRRGPTPEVCLLVSELASRSRTRTGPDLCDGLIETEQRDDLRRSSSLLSEVGIEAPTSDACESREAAVGLTLRPLPVPWGGAILRWAMSQNVETVRRLFTAFEGQDWQAALDLFDPAVEWSPTEGTYHGPEGVVSSLAEWFEPWEEHKVELEEVTNVGDRVLAVVHLTGRGAHSGIEIDQRFFQVYAVRGGRIIRMVEFVTRDDALDAAGVRDQES